MKMEITIKGTEKEIAGLVLELQNRQSVVIHENKTPSSLTAESIYEACRNYLAKEKMSLFLLLLGFL